MRTPSCVVGHSSAVVYNNKALLLTLISYHQGGVNIWVTLPYDEDERQPSFRLQVSSSLPIPIYAVWKLCRSPEATLLRRISANIRCRPEYGPLLGVNRRAYLKDLALYPPNFPARRRPQEDDLSAEGEPLSTIFPLVQSTAILIPQPQR